MYVHREYMIVLFQRWYFKKVRVRKLNAVNPHASMIHMKNCDPLCLLLFLLLKEDKKNE